MIRMMMLAMTLALTITGCKMKEKVDMILINGVVYTVDADFSIIEAFAVRDGMILDTGTTDKILGFYETSLVIDAGGKPVYPGFIDGHCHYYGYALGLQQFVNLRGTGSFEEILQILQRYHETHPYIWIIGRGWDQNDWPVKEFPDNDLLDQLFPGNPVVLTRVDGHAVLANSEALRRAGIDAETVIEGGEVQLRNGNPTGILLDNAADKMKAVIPEAESRVKADALLAAQKECFAVGLTSVVDAGLDYETVMLIDSLQVSGSLLMKINAMLSPNEKNLQEIVAKGPFRKERLTVNSVKLFADGALGSRGALLLEPYADDPGNKGLQMASEEYFREILRTAYDQDFQVNTHCIGDGANRMMLNLYAEMLRGKNDRRWRIEHAQVIHPDDFSLFGRYSIIPSIQATHCTSDMYWAEDRLGPERIKGAYAYKQLLEQNGWLINGTDFPVEEINPMLTFYASVTRRDKQGFPEGGFQVENALDREATLRSMTTWVAKGSFEEDVKGSLEPGKYADFIILDKDIMRIGPEEIPGTRVLKTYSSGEMVFDYNEPSE